MGMRRGDSHPQRHALRKTLVLDLDGTLVDCQGISQLERELDTYDLSCFSNGARVVLRPHLYQFLHEVYKHFELVLFTSMPQSQADAVLELVDPDQQLFSHRLYMQDTLETPEWPHVKDLSQLGRNLSNVVLIDHSPMTEVRQPENLISVTAYDYDSMPGSEDTELLDLVPFLVNEVLPAPDVRPVISRRKTQMVINSSQLDLGSLFSSLSIRTSLSRRISSELSNGPWTCGRMLSPLPSPSNIQTMRSLLGSRNKYHSAHCITPVQKSSCDDNDEVFAPSSSSVPNMTVISTGLHTVCCGGSGLDALLDSAPVGLQRVSTALDALVALPDSVAAPLFVTEVDSTPGSPFSLPSSLYGIEEGLNAHSLHQLQEFGVKVAAPSPPVEPVSEENAVSQFLPPLSASKEHLVGYLDEEGEAHFLQQEEEPLFTMATTSVVSQQVDRCGSSESGGLPHTLEPPSALSCDLDLLAMVMDLQYCGERTSSGLPQFDAPSICAPKAYASGVRRRNSMTCHRRSASESAVCAAAS